METNSELDSKTDLMSSPERKHQSSNVSAGFSHLAVAVDLLWSAEVVFEGDAGATGKAAVVPEIRL